ncbi:fibrobacter succinogenes major paralogous domain-containing protein [bacterium]|nr:fibrobacter succinogenes major paralogous domain-containing protein [bacterium]
MKQSYFFYFDLLKYISISLLLSLLFTSCDNKNPTESKESTVTDIDGNIYQTVKIGNQWWMAENLRVTHFRDGRSIPNITSASSWSTTANGYCCIYANADSNLVTYGMLYNWYAVNESRGLAPEGWHVPTDDDWKELEMYLGMNQIQADSTGLRGNNEGGKLKEKGTNHWHTPNYGAKNSCGFSARPGGCRILFGGGVYRHWSFVYISLRACFWSSTENSTFNAWARYLDYRNSLISRSFTEKTNGYAVRCIKDN